MSEIVQSSAGRSSSVLNFYQKSIPLITRFEKQGVNIRKPYKTDFERK